MSNIPETQYIAVREIIDDLPIFGKSVWASDPVSASIQFDLMDEPYVEVWLYVDDSSLYSFDDK